MVTAIAMETLVKTVCLVGLLLLPWVSSTATATTAGVVASGLGGTAEYAASFEADADTVAEALGTLDPANEVITRVPSGGDRAAILAAIDGAIDAAVDAQGDIGEKGEADVADTFILVLIGHGTADASGWKFNLPGPDLTSEDLITSLAGITAERQLIFLGTSASGALLEQLAQPGRIVVTATKSGGEINAVRFPSFFAEAVDSSVADVDRNEILTLAEAFRHADARTREYYEAEKLLASEHARIVGDDAQTFAIARLGSLRLASDDPAVASLLETRLTLERKYTALVARKQDMDLDDYYGELETLMLSIARLQQAIDRASGWTGDDA